MRDSTVSSAPNLLAIDVMRTRSSDSTEPVTSLKTFLSTRVTPSHKLNSWRTKDESSIFRPPSSDMPDMYSIKRCLAFDEDDWIGGLRLVVKYYYSKCHIKKEDAEKNRSPHEDISWAAGETIKKWYRSQHSVKTVSGVAPWTRRLLQKRFRHTNDETYFTIATK